MVGEKVKSGTEFNVGNVLREKIAVGIDPH
jgi:hypothetical protein